MSKRILIVSAFPPNRLTAGQSNTNTVVDDLLQKGFGIDLICFDFPGHKLERPHRFGYARIVSNRRIYKYLYALCLFFFFPIYTSKISLRVVWFIIRNQKGYDVIYLDYSQVFIYSLFISQPGKVYLMTHDLMIQRFSRANKGRWYKNILEKYVYFSESFFFRYSNNVILPSFKDKRIAKWIYGIEGIAILPKSRFKSPVQLSHQHCLKEFVFLGTWNRYENIHGLEWFVKNVHPLLNEELTFTVIGGSFPESFKSMLPPSFKVTGFVDDFTGYLHKASALISPLFLGAGIKFKVLDALSNGCRVIGTPVSFEGISLTKTGMMFSASSPAEFAEAINYCSMNGYDSLEIIGAFGTYLGNYKDLSDLI